MDKMELWCRGVDLRDTTYGAAFSLQQGPAQELLAEGLQGQRVSSDGIARRQPVLDGEGRGIVQHAVIEQKLEDPTVEIAVGGNSCAAQELGAGNGRAGRSGCQRQIYPAGSGAAKAACEYAALQSQHCAKGVVYPASATNASV